MIGAANLIGADMAKLDLDRVDSPLAAFIEKGGSSRAKAVSGGLVAGIAKPTKRSV